MFTSSLLGLAVAGVVAASPYAARNASLPIVDLGYQIHQAASFNETGRFFRFSNIRYAAPPVRFAAPEVPGINRSSVQTGDVDHICPQASPAWGTNANALLTTYLLTGKLPNNTTPYTPPIINASTVLPPQDPRVSEDCLFLDVVVPEKILKSAGSGYGAPVLVWIYGGGYTGGEKTNNPAGLFAASGNVSEGEVIYVALNYRLGALGWSSGPTYQAEGGVSNLGLLDQRLALEWVQSHIGQFGGDADKVTVFGESAGGGSIVHQITAYGGLKGPVPFQQAIPQSPGWLPVSSNLQQEDAFNRFKNLTGASSLEELRALSSEEVIRANTIQVLQSPYGSFTYGPVVDGLFAPLQPGQLLAQGRFDKSVRVMVGHNANEGAYFTAGDIKDTEGMKAQLRGNFPHISEDALDYVLDTLYPEVSAATPYKSEYERADFLVSEAIFTCNTNYLSTGFNNKTYSYLFAVPPAFHGLDVAYTYFTGGAVSTVNPLAVTNRTVAIALQEFITSFAITGEPDAEGIKQFNMYGPDAKVLELAATGIEEVRDTNANARCSWWQKALYS